MCLEIAGWTALVWTDEPYAGASKRVHGPKAPARRLLLREALLRLLVSRQ